MPEFDPSLPSIARVYDYFLGGKDNYAADREVADKLIGIVPLIPDMTVENRQFLSRSAIWAATQGISQFIDLGCGLPTVPNIHESVQAVTSTARVTYVDNDPVVIRHLQALFAHGNPAVSVVAADVADVDRVLEGARNNLDLSAPVCLIIGYLLHFYPADAARDLVGKYAAALAPGSCLVLSVLHYDGDAGEEGQRTYSSEVASLYMHTVPEITSFFGSFDLVPPGVADTRHWLQEKATAPVLSRSGFGLGGIASKR